MNEWDLADLNPCQEAALERLSQDDVDRLTDNTEAEEAKAFGYQSE